MMDNRIHTEYLRQFIGTILSQNKTRTLRIISAAPAAARRLPIMFLQASLSGRLFILRLRICTKSQQTKVSIRLIFSRITTESAQTSTVTDGKSSSPPVEKVSAKIRRPGVWWPTSVISNGISDLETEALDHRLIVERDSLRPKTMEALTEENFLIVQTEFRPTAENFAKYFCDRMIEKRLAMCWKQPSMRHPATAHLTHLLRGDRLICCRFRNMPAKEYFTI